MRTRRQFVNQKRAVVSQKKFDAQDAGNVELLEDSLSDRSGVPDHIGPERGGGVTNIQFPAT